MPREYTPLVPGSVHVWYVRLDPDLARELVAAYEALMSADEAARYRRFRAVSARREHLVARALVRTTLSRYTGVPPRAWRFTCTSHGRPKIAAPSTFRGIRFSLSHTAGIVACAVTVDRDIGIDVESVHRSPAPIAIAERFFSAAEVTVIGNLPEPERVERVYEYWTLKESYTKARGLGLSIPFDRFSFDLAHAPPISVSFDRQLGDDPRRWEFRLLRPTPDHVMALSIGRQPEADVQVEARETIPLIDDAP